MTLDLFDSNKFIKTEIENEITFEPIEPDENGFKVTVSFSKDPKENEEAMQAIKEFFIREIL